MVPYPASPARGGSADHYRRADCSRPHKPRVSPAQHYGEHREVPRTNLAYSAFIGYLGDPMPVEMAIWKMTDAGPKALTFSRLDLEKHLEDMIFEDPHLVGVDLLAIGRQVPTDFGGFIDLLGLDVDGRLHVLEIKRDRTPRDVVAQTMDYGSGCGI